MQRIARFLDQQVDGRMIGIARIMLGIASLGKGILMAALIHGYQTNDVVVLPYTSWGIATPAGTIASAATLLWIVLSGFFTIGFGTRLSGVLLAITIILVIGIDQQLYSNHLYLLLTLVVLMSLAHPGARFSIDARRTAGKGTVPFWAVTLIMLQLTSVYFFAAITKLNGGFLSGRVMESAFDPATLERIQNLVSLDILAPVAVVTELFLAFAFWSARLRLVALPVALVFHLANVMIMDRGGAFNLSIFALVMLSMMVVFFTPRPAVQWPWQRAPEAANSSRTGCHDSMYGRPV